MCMQENFYQLSAINHCLLITNEALIEIRMTKEDSGETMMSDDVGHTGGLQQFGQ
jgi:hypothetical protein